MKHKKPLLLLFFAAFTGCYANGQVPVFNTVTPNTSSIPKLQKFELTINLTAGYTNPYDYGDIAVKCVFTSPSNKQETVEGFYMQDYTLEQNGDLTPSGTGSFKVRFAPRETGIWNYTLSCQNLQGTTEMLPANFTCTASVLPGFIRKNNSNYLGFDDGSQFIPLGENMGWQNGGVVSSYTSWLSKLSSNGGNFIRVWMSSWAFALEWKNGSNGYEGLKKYKQQNAFYLDWLLEKCKDQGVYMMLCLNNHGQVSSNVNPEWSNNPYNASNGGPAANTWDFFSNTTAKDLHKNRLRYIIARYGHSQQIQSWELFNEVEWTDQFNTYKNQVVDWHKEMADYIKSKDNYQHLVTTSYAHDNEDANTWNYPNIDFTQTHYYNSSPALESVLAGGSRSYLANFGKPTINGEFGLNTDGNGLTSLDPNGIHIHNALWASTFSGAMGAAMTWWWDNYIDPQNLYYHFKPLSLVVPLVKFKEDNYKTVAASVSGGGVSDLSLSPGGDWGVAPAANFTIDASGNVNPAASQMSKYLYGSQWNTQLRNPPTFTITYPVAGQFKVVTGASTGTTPKISIYVDGELKLDNPASGNNTYTVNIDAGIHSIKVDNLGTDWTTISSYVFTNIGSSFSSYVLKAANSLKASGWILNSKYNWSYIKENNGAAPPFLSGGMVTIPGMQNGTYTIQFYNCETGSPGSVMNNLLVTNGQLAFNLPDVGWDLAFTAVENTTLPIKLAAFYGKAGVESNSLWLEIKESLNVNSIRIERSGNGINFNSIGSVTAKNNHYIGKHSFIDKRPLTGGNWYRLKVIDKDGSFSYSGIVLLKQDGNRSVSLFPNPVKDQLSISLPGASPGKYSIRVTGMEGKMIQQEIIETSLAGETFTFPFISKTKGIYLVTMVDAAGALIFKQKIIK